MRVAIQQYLGAIRHGRSPQVRAITAAHVRLAWERKQGRKGAGSIQLLGFTFHYGDFELFYMLFNEVFMAQTYLVPGLGDAPTIIDAGGNIGIATLFFKYFYPQAKIQVFEPDATNFELLQHNITSNRLKDVEAHHLALSERAGTLTLYERQDVSGGDIGVSVSEDFRRNYHGVAEIKAIKVSAKPLSSFIQQPVDLLKIDIEGSEGSVVKNLADTKKLSQIRHIVMEFHQIPENPLSAMLALLEANDQVYTIQQWGQDPRNPIIAHCILKTTHCGPS